MTFQSFDISGGNIAQLLTKSSSQAQSAKLSNAKASLDAIKDGSDEKAARDAAEQFEAVFISQFLAPIFDTVPTDGPFGGGHAEGVYRGFMVEEIGKTIAKNGGFGIADSVYNEILKLQSGGDPIVAQATNTASTAYRNSANLQEVSNAA